MCTRPSEPRPRRDVAASETRAETLRLSRVSGASTSRRDVFRDIWRNTLTMKKLYGLLKLHHGKRFLFVILWVFALYFDNYHWIINGLHNKELQLQCCRHEPLFYRSLQATEISELQLNLDVVYIWLTVFIVTSCALSSLRLGHFMTTKDWHDAVLFYDK